MYIYVCILLGTLAVAEIYYHWKKNSLLHSEQTSALFCNLCQMILG